MDSVSPFLITCRIRLLSICPSSLGAGTPEEGLLTPGLLLILPHHVPLPSRAVLICSFKKMLLIFSWVCWHPTNFPFRLKIKELKTFLRFAEKGFLLLFNIFPQKKYLAIIYNICVYIPSDFG